MRSFSRIVLITVLTECLTRSRSENPKSSYSVLPSVLQAADLFIEPEISITHIMSMGGASDYMSGIILETRNKFFSVMYAFSCTLSVIVYALGL